MSVRSVDVHGLRNTSKEMARPSRNFEFEKFRAPGGAGGGGGFSQLSGF